MKFAAKMGLLVLLGGLSGPVLAQPGLGKKATKLNNEAVALAKQEKYQEALALINEALEIKPEDEIFITNKSAFLNRLQRRDEALKVLSAALVQAPHSPKLRQRRADLLFEMDRPTEAFHDRLFVYAEGDEQPPATLPQLLPYNFQLLTGTIALRPNEVRLDGFVLSTAAGRLDFEVYLFALPSGRFRIVPAKPKTVLLQGIEPEFGDLGTMPVSQLKAGDYVSMVGREEKGNFTPRAMIVPLRTEAEEKMRGSLFNAKALPLGENEPDLEMANGSASFMLADGTQIGAEAAALLRDGNRTALVTTLSSLLQGNKWKLEGLSALEASSVVAKRLKTATAVKGLETDSEQTPLKATLPVRISPGVPFAGGEIVAVPVQEIPPKQTAFPLATTAPKRGEAVYLRGWYDGPTWWSEATVAYADAKRLFLHVGPEGEEERLPGTFIVNKKGEVVGLLVSGREPYLSAVPVEAIRRAMQGPVPQSPKAPVQKASTHK